MKLVLIARSFSCGISRLTSHIAGFKDVEMKASSGIEGISADIRSVEEENAKTEAAYWVQRLTDNHEFTIRTNDLVVFGFVMKVSMGNGPLSEVSDNAAPLQKDVHHVCEISGGLVLRFDDLKVQLRIERMMAPDARRALQEANGQCKKTHR